MLINNTDISCNFGSINVNNNPQAYKEYFIPNNTLLSPSGFKTKPHDVSLERAIFLKRLYEIIDNKTSNKLSELSNQNPPNFISKISYLQSVGQNYNEYYTEGLGLAFYTTLFDILCYLDPEFKKIFEYLNDSGNTINNTYFYIGVPGTQNFKIEKITSLQLLFKIYFTSHRINKTTYFNTLSTSSTPATPDSPPLKKILTRTIPGNIEVKKDLELLKRTAFDGDIKSIVNSIDSIVFFVITSTTDDEWGDDAIANAFATEGAAPNKIKIGLISNYKNCRPDPFLMIAIALQHSVFFWYNHFNISLFKTYICRIELFTQMFGYDITDDEKFKSATDNMTQKNPLCILFSLITLLYNENNKKMGLFQDMTQSWLNICSSYDSYFASLKPICGTVKVRKGIITETDDNQCYNALNSEIKKLINSDKKNELFYQKCYICKLKYYFKINCNIPCEHILEMIALFLTLGLSSNDINAYIVYMAYGCYNWACEFCNLKKSAIVTATKTRNVNDDSFNKNGPLVCFDKVNHPQRPRLTMFQYNYPSGNFLYKSILDVLCLSTIQPYKTDFNNSCPNVTPYKYSYITSQVTSLLATSSSATSSAATSSSAPSSAAPSSAATSSTTQIEIIQYDYLSRIYYSGIFNNPSGIIVDLNRLPSLHALILSIANDVLKMYKVNILNYTTGPFIEFNITPVFSKIPLIYNFLKQLYSFLLLIEYKTIHIVSGAGGGSTSVIPLNLSTIQKNNIKMLIDPFLKPINIDNIEFDSIISEIFNILKQVLQCGTDESNYSELIKRRSRELKITDIDPVNKSLNMLLYFYGTRLNKHVQTTILETFDDKQLIQDSSEKIFTAYDITVKKESARYRVVINKCNKLLTDTDNDYSKSLSFLIFINLLRFIYTILVKVFGKVVLYNIFKYKFYFDLDDVSDLIYDEIVIKAKTEAETAEETAAATATAVQDDTKKPCCKDKQTTFVGSRGIKTYTFLCENEETEKFKHIYQV
jgi:hypothetical protein